METDDKHREKKKKRGEGASEKKTCLDTIASRLKWFLTFTRRYPNMIGNTINHLNDPGDMLIDVVHVKGYVLLGMSNGVGTSLTHTIRSACDKSS
jgi:hypothetical protein